MGIPVETHGVSKKQRCKHEQCNRESDKPSSNFLLVVGKTRKKSRRFRDRFGDATGVILMLIIDSL
jgi:hypothetical protein